MRKRKRTVRGRALAALLACLLMLPGLAQASEVASVSLRELAPHAFDARGTAIREVELYDAPGGAALGTLNQREAAQVTDYLRAGGAAYFEILWQGAAAYVPEETLNVTFARPVPARVLQEGYAILEKRAATEEDPTLTLIPGLQHTVRGREDGWWILDSFEEGTLYAASELLDALPVIAARYEAAGSYGGDTMTAVEGSVVVEASDTVLSGMVIGGNLYLPDSFGGRVTLNDVYVLGGTYPLGDITIESHQSRAAEALGDPARLANEFFWAHYPEADAELLLNQLQDWSDALGRAVVGGEEGEE